MNSTRILISAEHRLLCECLAASLEDSGRFDSVKPCGDLEQARAQLAETPADLLLVDLSSSVSGAADTLAEIIRERPELLILIVGMNEAHLESLASLEMDPSAFSMEDVPLAELTAAVETAARGGSVSVQRFNQAMFTRLSELSRQVRLDKQLEALELSPRELETLSLIADGLTNHEIAERLCISLHTVKNHVHRILEKLQARNRTEAVALARKKQWLGTT